MTDLERTAEQLLDLYKFPQNMQSYSPIYIYGAGMVGRFVFRYLSSRGLENKIKCFLTTDYQEGEIQRVPVLKISKDVIDSGSIVLLAAKKQVRAEMRKICEQLVIKDFQEINVLDDRNYEYYTALSEETYPLELALWYKEQTGHDLNLTRPKTYNEKIQWTKLYGVTPLMTMLTDKVKVREWVKNKIGEKYLVPLLGIWKSADAIDVNSLPEKFILKCNHGCMYNEIVTDKTSVDWEDIRKKFNNYLKQNFAFVNGFEMQYKNIEPCILAEEYMENEEGDLFDYKFWCFDGKVRFVMFLSERKRHLRMNNYDLEWKLLPFTYNFNNTERKITKPKKLQEMIYIAEKLSEGFPHVRVDLYHLNNGLIKFGEMTFTSASGTCRWNPAEMDGRLGRYLHIKGSQAKDIAS